MSRFVRWRAAWGTATAELLAKPRPSGPEAVVLRRHDESFPVGGSGGHEFSHGPSEFRVLPGEDEIEVAVMAVWRKVDRLCGVNERCEKVQGILAYVNLLQHQG